MKKPQLRIILGFALAAVAGTWFPVMAHALDFTGYIRQYTAAFVSRDTVPLYSKDTAFLRAEHKTESISALADFYLHHYSGEKIETGLRQAWMEVIAEDFSIKIGKQQIVWGKAEGVFITDVVSPRDLREFLLQDFEEIRMGVTALRIRYAVDESFFEAVFVPGFVSTLSPDAGSYWYPEQVSAIPVTYDESQKSVSPGIRNAEAFFRYGYTASGLDFELVTGYMHDDDPARHLVKSVDPVSHMLTGITVVPQHHPLGLAGGSLSIPSGPIVFKSEIAGYFGKYFASDPMKTDGVLMREYIHAMSGLDVTFSGWTVGVQYILRYIPEYTSLLDVPQTENMLTFKAVRTWLRETVKLEVFSYIGLDQPDALVRTKIAWDVFDGFRLTAGVNLFLGETGYFGQYDKNDMLYTEARMSF